MISKVTKVVSYLVSNFPMKTNYIRILYVLDLSLEESKFTINKNHLQYGYQCRITLY